MILEEQGIERKKFLEVDFREKKLIILKATTKKVKFLTHFYQKFIARVYDFTNQNSICLKKSDRSSLSANQAL